MASKWEQDLPARKGSRAWDPFCSKSPDKDDREKPQSQSDVMNKKMTLVLLPVGVEVGYIKWGRRGRCDFHPAIRMTCMT